MNYRQAKSPETPAPTVSPELQSNQAEFNGTYSFRSGAESYGKTKMALNIDGMPTDSRENQDSYLRSDRHGVYIVADGVGGSEGGSLASQTATAAFLDAVVARKKQLHAARNNNLLAKSFLHEALAETDTTLLHAKQEAARYGDDEINRAATTLTAAVYLGGNKFAFVNAGDSAAFVINPQNEIEQITTEQCDQNKLYNALEGRGRPTLQTDPKSTDEVIIKEIDPGSSIILCTDGLLGDTPEQKITPEQLLATYRQFHDTPESTAKALVNLPPALYHPDGNILPREGVPKPKIDDTTALVVNVEAKQPNRLQRILARKAKAPQVAEAPHSDNAAPLVEATPTAPTPEPEPKPEEAAVEAPEPKHNSAKLQKLGKTMLGAARGAVYFPWIKFNEYQNLANEHMGFKHHKAAMLGGLAVKVAGAAAAVKYGFDIPDFDAPNIDMPDFNVPEFEIPDTVQDTANDFFNDVDNTWDSLWEKAFGQEEPAPTPPAESIVPQPFTFKDSVSSSMNAWDGSTSDTGYLNGTVYDQIAKSTEQIAHDNRINFDINELRQQRPDTFEHDYYHFVDQVLQDNNLTWDEAANLPAGSTLDIDGDNLKTFFNDQDIALPAPELSPENTHASPPQETQIHPMLIASVIAAGAATSLGAWLTTRRRKKNKVTSTV